VSRTAVILVNVLILLAIAFIAFWPCLMLAAMSFVASLGDCTVNEGAPSPCVIGGRDVGQALYTLGVLGWFMLATIPIGLGLFAVYLVVVLVAIGLRARRRRSRAEGHS
jgi:hypothetical protein